MWVGEIRSGTMQRTHCMGEYSDNMEEIMQETGAASGDAVGKSSDASYVEDNHGLMTLAGPPG